MKTLQVIMAHREAEARLHANWPQWARHKDCDIVVTAPTNAAVPWAKEAWLIGNKGHHGKDANDRFRRILERLAVLDYERFVVHEYDSFCSVDEYPVLDPGFLWATVWSNDDPRFSAPFYFHPPLLMTRNILVRIVDALKPMATESEGGFWDRWLGKAVHDHYIPNMGYGRLGFSRNTIAPACYSEAKEARAKGAIMWHGVKSDEAYRIATS